MKRIQISAAAILAVFCLLLSACGQNAPTWQEQYDLGVRYLSEGNYEEAIIAFNAAIEIDPKRAEAYLSLAETYVSLDDPERAAEILYSGWENCPDDGRKLLRQLERLGYDIAEDGGLISFQELEAAAISAYQEIQDTIYNGIVSQWRDVDSALQEGEDAGIRKISYLWYRFPVLSLDEAGFMLKDLNDDHVPELLISTADAMEPDGAAGMIYDLYTYREGEVVHLLSSGERDRYYLCEDNIIANEGSSGAADSAYRYYELEKDADALRLREQVRYYGMETPETPWFYGTADTYDVSELTQISETEAMEIVHQYVRVPLTLTLFGLDAPQPAEEEEPWNSAGDWMPADFLSMTVGELSNRFGGDFTYLDYWYNGTAKGLYYEDLRLPLVFYFLDAEYRGYALGGERIAIVECSPKEQPDGPWLAPGIPMQVTYGELLEQGFEGDFYTEGDDWLQEMGETSMLFLDISPELSIQFYWFDYADPYTEPADIVQLYGGL